MAAVAMVTIHVFDCTILGYGGGNYDSGSSYDGYGGGSYGAPIAQLGECQTFDRKVTSLIPTQGVLLCPSARHFIPIA